VAEALEISEPTDGEGRRSLVGSAIRDARPAGVNFLDTGGPKPSIPPASRRRGKAGQVRPYTAGIELRF
jgi:hypothetical protein